MIVFCFWPPKRGGVAGCAPLWIRHCQCWVNVRDVDPTKHFLYRSKQVVYLIQWADAAWRFYMFSRHCGKYSSFSGISTSSSTAQCHVSNTNLHRAFFSKHHMKMVDVHLFIKLLLYTSHNIALIGLRPLFTWPLKQCVDRSVKEF